jgi:SAM-dependent methyltransferase
MEKRRRNLQGVLNILSFNRHFYITGSIVLAGLIALHSFFNWPPLVLILILVAFLYGFLMPLLVSAYIYDLSGFYTFNWVDKYLSKDGNEKLVVNINAGFDETSFIIHDKLPQAELKVFDFYDEHRHTEPAIIRARKVSNTYPETKRISSETIPLPEKSVDIIFLVSAIHEIRSQEEKIRFLKECNRICKSDGSVIMVEHLRDFPNFVAFTIGFTHFFSRSVWKDAFKRAGFSSFQESKFTPFMSVFKSTP